MALDTYAGLQAAIKHTANRSDWTDADVKDFITLAEATLNQNLKTVDAVATLTGTIGSRYVSTSALTVLSPETLWITVAGQECKINPASPTSMAYLDEAGRPTEWIYDDLNDRLVFNVPLSQAYSIRFAHISRFNLSDTVTTNGVLSDHPNVYLNYSLAEGYRFAKDYQTAAYYDGLGDKASQKIRNIAASRKKARLRVDAGLARIGGNHGYNVLTDS